MSFQKHQMWSVVCDFASCTKDASQFGEISAWTDKTSAEIDASECGWLEYEGQHFCLDHQHHCEKVDESRPGAPVDCDCQED